MEGYAILPDDLARQLVEVCPPHKIVIDGWFELPVASNAVGAAGSMYWQLTGNYKDFVNNTPVLKALMAKHAMRIHEIVKQQFALAREVASMAAEIGIAIEKQESPTPHP